MASLLLRTTMSLPMSCKYRISVPSGRQCQSSQEIKRRRKNTMVLGQRHETFPDRDTHGEIQDISKNRITLWTWWVWQSGFLPLPNQNEDGNTEQQWVEHRSVKHGGGGRVQGRRAGSLDATYILVATTIYGV